MSFPCSKRINISHLNSESEKNNNNNVIQARETLRYGAARPTHCAPGRHHDTHSPT